ncbi:hypothetical protein IAQ61_010745 [Plenodomus lingam]|uniref:uncharacterized protein n=1 Tax=Leptosphaeria maculans TaxID=5022 RepID=UPI00332BD7CB|nr:hypothetical protein IAQ61_010745 [Plenodomus lingam]
MNGVLSSSCFLFHYMHPSSSHTTTHRPITSPQPALSLKPQASNLKPQTSSLKPQASNLKPQAPNNPPLSYTTSTTHPLPTPSTPSPEFPVLSSKY